MSDNQLKEDKQSFITEARREQIIEAAINTLDEIGFVKASLAQIAKRAGISTALISYHFAGKNDLMDHLLITLLDKSTSYILQKVHQEKTPNEKLKAFIHASLEYQVAHPAHHTALIEIVFHARTPDNTPYYKLSDDDEDPMLKELEQILQNGQNNGLFGDFHVDVMANMIQGAIGEYMFNTPLMEKIDVQRYSKELIHIVEKALKN